MSETFPLVMLFIASASLLLMVGMLHRRLLALEQAAENDQHSRKAIQP